MSNKNSYNFLKTIITGAGAFLLTSLVMLIVLKALSCAPFGLNSLAAMDANMQYLDLFAYLKDVFAGENTIGWTFSKSIGGNTVAMFGYYLSSPFSFLVCFFDKSDLYTFFDILVVLKLGSAAFTCAVFLNLRFCQERYNQYDRPIIVLLSAAYALCQYNLQQTSNVMWLDGVYMLPLMWVGVWRIVRGKTSWVLTICTALSILFNWYTGAINCLFSVIIFLFELFIRWSEEEKTFTIEAWKDGVIKLIRYGLALLCGIFISAILFVPVISELRQGSKGGIDFASLFHFFMTGEIASVVQGYTLGAGTSLGSVSLFCGSFVLIGSICCFVSKSVSPKKKLALGCMAGVVILLFYWWPFCHLFFLLRECSSYIYRYGYIGILALVFFAAIFWLEHMRNEKAILPVKAALGFSGVLLVLNYINGRIDRNLLMIDVLLLLAISAAVTVVFIWINGQKSRKMIVFALMAVTVLEFAELAYNAKISITLNDFLDADAFASYVMGAEIQAAALKNFDNTSYRVSQTSTRNMGMRALGLTNNYNEPIAYNWWGLSTSTSSPDEIPIGFLDKLGYRRAGGGIVNTVHTSILGADSLLGVKYVLADYPINGLTELGLVKEYNGKNIYYNPYCLPLCFTYNPAEIQYDASNPFTYQNSLYSELLGEEICLYTPVNFSIIQEGDADRPLIYQVEIPNNHCALYGNLPWRSSLDAELSANGVYRTAYAGWWLSPSVFYIPAEEDATTATIEIFSRSPYDFRYGEEQFYALNLDALGEATSRLISQEADVLTYENGHIEIATEGKSGEMLYTSVPYDQGWKIWLNGKKITPELLGECMQVIPLTDGKNFIEMKYYIRGLGSGMLFSCMGLLMMFGTLVLEKRIGKRI